jgi:putative hydrolase of the HAD superfamily
VSLTPDLLEVDFWNRYHLHCQGFPDLLETLEELRRRGKALGIVTNGSVRVQEATIDALSIRALLKTVVISEAEGVRKPSPVIFHRAAVRVGASPAECLYVGDHPEIDVAGAEAAGFKALWKRTSYWSARIDVPRIESLSDLLSFV